MAPIHEVYCQNRQLQIWICQSCVQLFFGHGKKNEDKRISENVEFNLLNTTKTSCQEDEFTTLLYTTITCNEARPET